MEEHQVCIPMFIWFEINAFNKKKNRTSFYYKIYNVEVIAPPFKIIYKKEDETRGVILKLFNNKITIQIKY